MLQKTVGTCAPRSAANMPGEVAPAAPAPPGQQQQQQGGFNQILMTVARMAFMWWIMSWFKGGKQAPGRGDPVSHSLPKLQKGALLDMYAFLNEKAYVVGGNYHMEDLGMWVVCWRLRSGPDTVPQF